MGFLQNTIFELKLLLVLFEQLLEKIRPLLNLTSVHTGTHENNQDSKNYFNSLIDTNASKNIYSNIAKKFIPKSLRRPPDLRHRCCPIRIQLFRLSKNQPKNVSKSNIIRIEILSKY